MVRKITGWLALLIAGGLSMAAQEKKEEKKNDYSRVIGTFLSYKNETLTLKVDEQEKKFKVPEDTPVGYSAGKDETGKDKFKILKAKDHLKEVKKGAFVAVTLDRAGKKVLALGVVVSELPKGKPKGKDEESDK